MSQRAPDGEPGAQVAGSSPGGVLDGPEAALGEGVGPAAAPEAIGAGAPVSRRRPERPRETNARWDLIRMPEQYSPEAPAGGAGTRCTLDGP